MLGMADVKKLTWWINTALLGFVALMTLMFARYGVTYMVYHSIPTVAAYIGMYGLIRGDKLDVYVLVVYIVITVYMVAATVCMGFNAGYHLYCASLIPLAFYMSYLGNLLHTRKLNAIVTSAILVVIYLGCTSFAVLHGPVYEVDEGFVFRCMIGNAIAVFAFLIGYTSLVHHLVRSSEERLSQMAHKDQLTGLYNRHYLMTYLEELHRQASAERWIAMADIDDFKRINDTYGHHGGDYALVEMTRLMREVCGDCVMARWGGEEFLIAEGGGRQDPAILERLRERISQTPFLFEGQRIPMSITVGVARYEAGMTLDQWIQSADRKLYVGKNSGKDQVID